MPNQIRKGSDSMPYRHNRREIALSTGIPAELKDGLIAVAQARRVPLKVVIAEAVADYLLAVNA